LLGENWQAKQTRQCGRHNDTDVQISQKRFLSDGA
jgi:hypothetical protein